MKRSQINTIINEAEEFFAKHHFLLPPWAFWAPANWKGKYEPCREIIDNMLGWDVTPFSSDDFYQRGLLAFTIRNGNVKKDKKPYGEKILMVDENQETPFHFHWSKMEDIINRSGGRMIIQLWNADQQSEARDDRTSVHVSIDGIEHTVPAGGTIVLTPGEFVTLPPYMYHLFYAEKGSGMVLCGEVSRVNDDEHDNRFLEPLARFPDIEEDQPPTHLLCTEYPPAAG